MKHKRKIKNPDEFYIGMRVKLPFGGWWFGDNRKTVWVKGRIVKLGKVKEDGKIHGVITHCYSKQYGTLGSFMSLNEQCDEIYKVK